MRHRLLLSIALAITSPGGAQTAAEPIKVGDRILCGNGYLMRIAMGGNRWQAVYPGYPIMWFAAELERMPNLATHPEYYDSFAGKTVASFRDSEWDPGVANAEYLDRRLLLEKANAAVLPVQITVTPPGENEVSCKDVAQQRTTIKVCARSYAYECY